MKNMDLVFIYKSHKETQNKNLIWFTEKAVCYPDLMEGTSATFIT